MSTLDDGMIIIEIKISSLCAYMILKNWYKPTMSLLGDLWGGAEGVAGGDGVEGGREGSAKVVVQEMTFAQVVSSSSSEDGGGARRAVGKQVKGTSPIQRAGGRRLRVLSGLTL